MPSSIALCKFIGTISLGLLTGVSYTLTTLTLPSLLTLPTARTASYTLTQTTRLATLHIRTLSGIAAFSLGLAYWLSPTRVRHPYLIWTAGVGVVSGGLGVVGERRERRVVEKGGVDGGVDGEGEEGVNGEMVEKRARDRQLLEGVRMGVSAVGFVMGVVGIWGDGA